MKGKQNYFFWLSGVILITFVILFFQVSCNLEKNDSGTMSYKELENEVKLVEMSSDKMAAIKDLAERLPFSAKVRALQREAEQLQKRLELAADQQEAAEINNELHQLFGQMMEDPTYMAIIGNLRSILVPASNDSPDGTRAISGFNSLQRGDIMCVRSGLFDWMMFIYAMWYSHTGNYDGSGLVYESNADGVRLQPLSKWQQPGQYIGLGRDKKRTVSQVQTSLNAAKSRYGTDGRTPYNYFYPDKTTDARLYCSQLTWKIHNNIGVNLDSNHWTYILYITAAWGVVGTAVAIPAVAPDEVSLSGNVTMYAEGWNE